MTIILGNDHGCLLNKKVGLWCPYQHIQRAPKSYAAPLSYADLSDFYTRDFLLWFSTSNISAPFNWKIPKIGMGNHTNPINKVFLWSMAEIPTMSENKARESGIFGFPWFQPCLFSQKRWGAETWPGNIELTVSLDLWHGWDFGHDHKESLEVWFPIPNFGIFQLNGAEIFDVENHKGKSLL